MRQDNEAAVGQGEPLLTFRRLIDKFKHEIGGPDASRPIQRIKDGKATEEPRCNDELALPDDLLATIFVPDLASRLQGSFIKYLEDNLKDGLGGRAAHPEVAAINVFAEAASEVMAGDRYEKPYSIYYTALLVKCLVALIDNNLKSDAPVAPNQRASYDPELTSDRNHIKSDAVFHTWNALEEGKHELDAVAVGGFESLFASVRAETDDELPLFLKLISDFKEDECWLPRMSLDKDDARHSLLRKIIIGARDFGSKAFFCMNAIEYFHGIFLEEEEEGLNGDKKKCFAFVSDIVKFDTSDPISPILLLASTYYPTIDDKLVSELRTLARKQVARKRSPARTELRDDIAEQGCNLNPRSNLLLSFASGTEMEYEPFDPCLPFDIDNAPSAPSATLAFEPRREQESTTFPPNRLKLTGLVAPKGSTSRAYGTVGGKYIVKSTCSDRIRCGKKEARITSTRLKGLEEFVVPFVGIWRCKDSDFGHQQILVFENGGQQMNCHWDKLSSEQKIHLGVGLRLIHGQGVLHRSINPRNVVLETPTSLPRWIDFGGSYEKPKFTARDAESEWKEFSEEAGLARHDPQAQVNQRLHALKSRY
ncbi:uncharacterized protein JCM6883_004519 [Sporobolomyces salmoneus]|uniref:uncharacterized protein n=1 Tax=Sporobolomyces salmoneus TaxID=183962 RepID=UPI003171F6FD